MSVRIVNSPKDRYLLHSSPWGFVSEGLLSPGYLPAAVCRARRPPRVVPSHHRASSLGYRLLNTRFPHISKVVPLCPQAPAPVSYTIQTHHSAPNPQHLFSSTLQVSSCSSLLPSGTVSTMHPACLPKTQLYSWPSFL